MLTPDPESVGRQTAEALVDSLDQLKLHLMGSADAPLESQLKAGAAAVEAMKRLMSGVVDAFQPDEIHKAG